MNPPSQGVNLGLSLLIFAGAAALPCGARANEPVVESYLVLPFENKKGNAELDPYSGALAHALAERLEAHPLLRPAFGAAVLPDVRPPVGDEQAAELARTAGG